MKKAAAVPAAAPTAVVTYDKPDLPIVGYACQLAANVIVDDQATYDMAIDTGRKMRVRRAEIEAMRVTLAKPINEAKDAVQAMFMPVLKDYDSAILAVNKVALVWVAAEEEKRRAAQAEADRKFRESQAAAEKAAAKLEKKNPELAEAFRENAALAIAPVLAPAVVQSGGTAVRKTWKGRVTDIQKLVAFIGANPAYIGILEIRQGALDKMIHAHLGRLELPGVENVLDANMAIRS